MPQRSNNAIDMDAKIFNSTTIESQSLYSCRSICLNLEYLLFDIVWKIYVKQLLKEICVTYTEVAYL